MTRALLACACLLWATPALAQIGVDAASSTSWTYADSTTRTTTAINPGANVLHVACVWRDDGVDGSPTAPAVTNSDAALTWTQAVVRTPTESGGGAAWIAAYWAYDSTDRASITFTWAYSNTAHGAIHVTTFTGTDSASMGTTGEGNSTTNNITPTIYTSTVDNSRGYGCADDWNALGTPVSTDDEVAGHTAGIDSYLSARKSTNTTPSSTAVTMNFDAAGTGAADWAWVALEIRPAAGGGPAGCKNGLLLMGAGC